MRIGIDYRMAKSTGIGTYITNIFQLLLEHGKYNYVVFCDADMVKQTQSTEAVSTHAPIYSLAEQIELPWITRKAKVDLMLFPHYSAPIIKTCPSIVVIHDVIHLKFPEYLPKPRLLAYMYAWSMMKMQLLTAKKIITVSEATKRDIIDIFGMKYRDITVIPNGVDKSFFQPVDEESKEQVLKKYGIQEPFFFYVGMHKPHKNLGSLLEAFKVVTQTLTDCLYLVIAGKETHDTRVLRQLVSKLKLEDRVKFIGYVDQDDMPALYQQALAFVLPSLYEGFGLPILEAQASKTIVIASNSGSIPEVLGDGGILFDPYSITELANKMSAVLQHLSDPDLVSKGLRNARKYSWERSAKLLLDTIKSTVN